MPMSRPVRLIVNPSSGGGRALQELPKAEAALTRLGLTYAVHPTTDLEHGRELARAGVENGELVTTLSGDGLVGAVAGAMAGRPGAVLGILPAGRGNDLARVLGIPRDDLDAACAILRDGVERSLDLGRVDGEPFVGIASLGFDSDANRVANEAPSWLGPMVYAYAALRAIASWQPATFTIEADDEPGYTLRGWSVGLCNNKAYGGGMYVAPGAELDDGLLDLVTCEDMPKTRFVTKMLPAAFKGRTNELPEVSTRRVRQAHVAADRPFVVYADGDPIGELPATFTVEPAAVRVMVARTP
jgi:YegS/Rv2252/BmrU family lipid kinase